MRKEGGAGIFLHGRGIFGGCRGMLEDGGLMRKEGSRARWESGMGARLDASRDLGHGRRETSELGFGRCWHGGWHAVGTRR